MEYFRRDGGHLLGRLALREDNLGEAGADVAVVVDLGKVEVFEREEPQLLDDVVGAEVLVLEAVEQRPEAGLVYVCASVVSGAGGETRATG